MNLADLSLPKHTGSKFGPPKDPLQMEEALNVIMPREESRKAFAREFVQINIEQSRDPHEKQAWLFWSVLQTMDDYADFEDHSFLVDYWSWLQGLGTDDDHDRTNWGRVPLTTFRFPDIIAYVDSFLEKKFAYASKLIKLHRYGPTNLKESYIYFKYIVRGDLNNIDDGFLKDWNKFLSLGHDDNDAEGRDKNFPKIKSMSDNTRDDFLDALRTWSTEQQKLQDKFQSVKSRTERFRAPGVEQNFVNEMNLNGAEEVRENRKEHSTDTQKRDQTINRIATFREGRANDPPNNIEFENVETERDESVDINHKKPEESEYANSRSALRRDELSFSTPQKEKEYNAFLKDITHEIEVQDNEFTAQRNDTKKKISDLLDIPIKYFVDGKANESYMITSKSKNNNHFLDNVKSALDEHSKMIENGNQQIRSNNVYLKRTSGAIRFYMNKLEKSNTTSPGENRTHNDIKRLIQHRVQLENISNDSTSLEQDIKSLHNSAKDLIAQSKIHARTYTKNFEYALKELDTIKSVDVLDEIENITGYVSAYTEYFSDSVHDTIVNDSSEYLLPVTNDNIDNESTESSEEKLNLFD